MSETPNILLMDDDICSSPRPAPSRRVRQPHPTSPPSSAARCCARCTRTGCRGRAARVDLRRTDRRTDTVADTRSSDHSDRGSLRGRRGRPSHRLARSSDAAGDDHPPVADAEIFSVGLADVTLPSAARALPDFARKDADDWPRYFSVRNAQLVSRCQQFDLVPWFGRPPRGTAPRRPYRADALQVHEMRRDATGTGVRLSVSLAATSDRLRPGAASAPPGPAGAASSCSSCRKWLSANMTPTTS